MNVECLFHKYLIFFLSVCFCNLFSASQALGSRLPTEQHCFLLFCWSLVQLLFWEAAYQGLVAVRSKPPREQLLMLFSRYLFGLRAASFLTVSGSSISVLWCKPRCSVSLKIQVWFFGFFFTCRVYWKPLVSLVSAPECCTCLFCGNWCRCQTFDLAGCF